MGIRTSHTAELQGVLASQEQCAVQGDNIEATCRTEWNRQIEETRAHYEEQKEIVREERDLELENTRQNLDAELARVRAEYTTQYEAIQQSREQQILRLTEEREAECAAAGFEAECTDRFDDQIEAERVRMEQELERMRLERDRALLEIETRRTGELERQGRLDTLREEWRVSCTDQCDVCRETQEELLEEVHLEYEEKILLARLRFDEETSVTETRWKETMDLERVQATAVIDRLYAERDATCPDEAASMEMTCRERYNSQLEEIRSQRDTELEEVLAQKEIRLEQVRIQHEDQIMAITEQKAEKLRQIETEEAVQLEMLRQQREQCAIEGNEHEASCIEEHDAQLDEIRTRRDAALEAVRVQSEQAQLQIMAAARDELVVIQAQLEQQLRNIREQRYMEIERVMRTCEGGNPEEGCPAFDCSMCPAVEVTTAAPVVEAVEEETYAEHEARAVEEALAEAGITSEYRVSLAWESTADLDIYIENAATGEVIFYANKVSSNGAMELDIDQQAGSAGQHVENISFDGGVHADYNVYVTNYATNSDQGEIHFVVVTKQGRTVETFEDSWDIGAMGIEQHNRLENMMAITTVHVVG